MLVLYHVEFVLILIPLCIVVAYGLLFVDVVEHVAEGAIAGFVDDEGAGVNNGVLEHFE